MQRLTHPYCGLCGHDSEMAHAASTTGIRCTYCGSQCIKFSRPAGPYKEARGRTMRLGNSRTAGRAWRFNTLVGGMAALSLGMALGGLYTRSGNATGLFIVALLSAVCFFAALDRP